MSHKKEEVDTNILRRQMLFANVIRACKNCGAPGFWHDTPGVNVGCYAPEKITKLGMDPVGEICPQCGHSREAIEPHGMIWSKVWRVNFWAALKSELRDIFNGNFKWRIR